jgi:restriction endonuclease S subunit
MERQYKDSGIEWIGRIPVEWKVMPHKWLMKKIKEICPEYKGEDIISLTMNGVIVRDLNAGGKMPTTFDGYQYVYPGNLLLCLFDIDVTPRCVGLINNEGLTSPAYSQFRPFKEVYGPYYNYLLRYMDDEKCLLHLSKNLRSSLTEEDFGQIPTVYPPFSVQQRIAEYLDEKCKEIDTLIALQEQMIAQLTDYKQSVITEAVTKGLNPNAQLVPSGIDWIGDVPQGWRVMKVKHAANSFDKGNGITKEEVFINGNMPCVRYGEIYSKYQNSFISCLSATNIEIQKSPHYFHYGDILCAGTGELVEEIGKSIVYLGEDPCLAGGDIIVISHHQEPTFFNYALNSHYAQAQKSKSKAKLKVVHISAFEIGSVYVVLPSLSEQRAIAEHLDIKCGEIDKVIETKRQKIETLKEYKKSVIFEAVTGKTIID